MTTVAAPLSKWGVALALSIGATARAQTAARFTVSDTSVRQGGFEAIATSRDTILSSYPRAAREVRFRFSINGLENEFPGGTEHTIYLRPHNGLLVTSVYIFGDEREPLSPAPEASASSEDGMARVTFRVDLRALRDSLNSRGFYTPHLGARINRGELAHVYVVGEPAPLTWDYSALHPGSPLELHDANGDGIYEGVVAIPTEYTRPRTSDGRGIWARTLDLAAYPQLSSKQRMQDAIYRLSLEELRQLVRDDGALSAGAKWPGVWTRDVSLSTILSLAIVAPGAAKRSLLAKVDSSGRIIQDTGTGGSWPVSSDRMVWSLAAWEIYAMTGDRAWLRQSYDVIRRSAEADVHAVRDRETGLFDGESSFMDWREQSYPRWMQPADIYRSQNLGTNAIHYAAYRVLTKMSRVLGAPEPRWKKISDSIQRGMTTELWQADRGWYAQYRYGRSYLSLSPRADGLGEALAAIFGAATPDQRATLIRSAPVVAYGTPTFWPFIPGERFYHNATIWPFVTAYWTWAAASGGNTLAVQRGLDDATRSTALFLTNKENMVAATGHYEGTALNSDRQLWSVAGTLASTYRILFGMRLEDDCISFRPMVPPSYGGERTLSGVHYRNATLTITVRGFGDSVSTATLDGKAISHVEIPETVTGAHTLDITMNGRWPASTVNEVPSRFAPEAPQVALRGGALVWDSVPGAVTYAVYEDGVRRRTTTATRSGLSATNGRIEFQVLAINAVGDESFLSEPARLDNGGAELRATPALSDLARARARFRGTSGVTLSLEEHLAVCMPVTIDREGTFAIDAHYANGNGPINTEDKAAVRTLLVDGDTLGVIVMPQRGTGNWSQWGWSNVLRAHLGAGAHILSLIYTPLDANMNRHENTALLDFLRLTPLANPDRGSR